MVHRIVPRALAAFAVMAAISAFAFAAAEKHQGKVTDTGKGKFTMTDMDGKNKHTHELAGDVKITLNGKAATIEDLKKGSIVEVTVEKKDGKDVVTAISARNDTDPALETKSKTAKSERAYQTPDKPGSAPTRASKMIGAAVKNSASEDLGKIEDIVMDPHSGSVRYAVLSFGGFLGLGDKWFAIPWNALAIHYDNEKKDKFHFVLNVDKERLKNAPGFDSKSWPDFGNPRWSSEVDTYYGK